jgi:DNA replication protein DnaC
MKRLNSCELLVLDDFLLHSISEEQEMKVLYELLEKRSELSRSTIVCSQREPKSWGSMMLNDEVSANSIVKRATKHYTVVINPKTT